MQLSSVGEICILDYSDVSGMAIGEVAKYNDKLTAKDRRFITDLVAEMIDDYLTTKMWWTKCPDEKDSDIYIGKFQGLLDDHPDPYEMIEQLRDEIAKLLRSVIKLPTWNVVYMRRRTTGIEIEMGEDYRVTDWMKRHAKEYLSRRDRPKEW